MLHVGDRIKNNFNGLIAKVYQVKAYESNYSQYADHYWFAVYFEDDAAGERHYARNGPDGSYVFTRMSAWQKIEPAPVPMEDTRDYLNSLNGLEALFTV